MSDGSLKISRRVAMALGAGFFVQPSWASTVREITWDDLIPPGVPYSEIVGEGDLDLELDTWRPIFDENATKLNDTLDGVFVKLPGYIVPLEQSSEGITEFILVPYFGACTHVPPPPANQLVMVKAETPWPVEDSYDAVWVHGLIRTQLQSTTLADIGYAMTASTMELYDWF